MPVTPDVVIDLETTGLIAGHGKPRHDVGISEFALYSTKGPVDWHKRWGFEGGHTDILQQALSSNLSVEEYHQYLTGGMPAWQEGYATPGDVLAGVHERHVVATRRALQSGSTMAREKDVLSKVRGLLGSGKSVGGWNIEFDFGILEDVARRHQDSKFIHQLNQAYNEGRIVEMSDPARRFLFNLARGGDITLGQTRQSAKALAAAPGTRPGDIAALTVQQMVEPHTGFQRLFKLNPQITYEEYRAKVAGGGLEDLLGVQEFSAGLRRPKFRYVKGWRQQVLAETINPGFLENPTRTQLGQEIAKRLNLQQGEKVTAHLARDDTVLTGILHEIFSSKDPWQAMSGYGVKSKEQFLTQYNTARENDLRLTLRTYLGEQSKHAMDTSYLRKVLSGAAEMEARAPEVARAAGTPAGRFPGLRSVARGTYAEVREAAYKHPKISATAAVLGGLLIADSLIPEDNKLEGLRRPDSKYARIGGINFGGIGSPATYTLTDFGSGRSEDNASSQIRAWKLTRERSHPDFRSFSMGDVQRAHEMWTSALSRTNRRLLERGEYSFKKGRQLSIPGVSPDAWLGSVDLSRYKVKAEDADTIMLYRRGLLHMLDRPVAVRLAGIDAPESHDRWPFGIQPMGVESGEYLRKLIEAQDSLNLLIDPHRTTYGRHIGVLSGNVNPNINLKLVSAGAAGALPSRKGITTAQKYKRAEAIAAASGLGMWSSKGWQAKRMLDMAVGQTVTNVTYQSARRISEQAGLEESYYLIQSLHGSPSEKMWEAGEIDAVQQVMQLRHQGAEEVRPVLSRFMPQSEPIMTPSPKKSALTGWSVQAWGRDTARASLGTTVGRRLSPVRHAQHRTHFPAMGKASGAVSDSGAMTSVSLTQTALGQRQIQTVLAAQYAAQAAFGAPWRPLNEYQAVHGGDFAGNYQIRAWEAFNAGNMSERYSAAIYHDLYRILKKRGFSPGSAVRYLKRNAITRAARRAFKNEVEPGTKAGSAVDALWGGHVASVQRWAKNFVAGRPRSFHELMTAMKDEFKIRQSLWHRTVTQESTKLGKAGAFAEFMGYVGHPHEFERPTNLAAGSLSAEYEPGLIQKVRNWLGEPQGMFGRRNLRKAGIKVLRQASAIEGGRRFAMGLGKLGKRILSKTPGGAISQSLFTVPSAFMASSDYKNQYLGFGTEMTAGLATAGAWAVTHGAVWAAAGMVGTYAGGAAGGIIGGLIGTAVPGIGNIAGAEAGATAGAVIGKTLSIIAAELIYGVILDKVIGDPIRTAGGAVAGHKVPQFASAIPGMNADGRMDAYLEQHGMQPSAFSGFGGGLKYGKELKAVGETIGLLAKGAPGAIVKQAPRIERRMSRLEPTAGLTNIVLWGRRRGITRGKIISPVQWGKKPRIPRHHNGSRMMRAA